MHHLTIRRPAAALLLASATLAVACGELPTDASATAERALAPSGALAASAPTRKVARVLVTFVSGGGVDRSKWTIAGGETQQFSVLVYDSAGKAISGRTATFQSVYPGTFSVDSTTGLGTAIAKGTAAVRATVDGVSGKSANFTVLADAAAAPSPTEPQPEPEPEPEPQPSTPPPTTQSTPSANAMPVQVVRFDGGSGAATVTAGVPLTRGALRPGQEGNVRVFIGGVEQPVYAKGLSSLHLDGSLRAVLVQFRLASLSASTPARGVLDLSVARTTAMTVASPLVTPGTQAAGAAKGLPQAAILPTNPSYLVQTDLVGPTTESAATSALGGAFARYESNFSTYAEQYWATEGAAYALANYYDRALIFYAWWARTGDATWWSRATRLAYDYRMNYLVVANYGASPHWSQLEGVEKHYLLTGDEASRQAVVKTAGRLAGMLTTSYMTSKNGEGRIAARVLHAQLLAWRLTPAGSPAVTGDGVTNTNWGTNVETAIAKLVAWQKPNGSFPATGQVCGGQLNYMIGLQNDALIKTYDYYVPSATSRSALQGTIRTLVTKAVDYLWSTQWNATKGAFAYASVDCTSKGVGGTGAAPDLNNLISAGFGWVYRQTGDAKYRSAGETIFTSGATKAFLEGSKQFNENYTSSFRYLGYR